jgi:hypothetical protein
MAIAKGTEVKQVVAAPITGVVDSFSVDQETGQLQYLVKWADADGEECSKYFQDGEIAPV